MKLKASQLRTLGPGRHPDGQYGLYFNVKPSGTRSWVQRLVIDGVRRTFGLGPFPVVTLGEARDQAIENVRKRRAGLDPIAERRRVRSVPTFAAAADQYIKLQSAGWKAGSRNESNWRSSLVHAQRIADRPIDAIGTDDVIALLGALVRAGKAPTAKALRQRIRAIMDWARSKGYRADNPADERIDAALPKDGHKVEHRAALDHADVPEAFAKIGTVTGSQRGAALGLQFLILTGVRRDEARLAQWSEVDTGTKTWTIPASRTKTGKAFRVPLGEQALAVLAEARALGCKGGYVFCGARGGRVNEGAFLDLLRGLRIDCTAHGLRSSLRSWMSDAGVPRDVAEWSLNHAFMSDTEASYARSDLLERRRPILERWSQHVDEPQSIVQTGKQ